VVSQEPTVYRQSRTMVKSIGVAVLVAVLLGAVEILTGDFSAPAAAGVIGSIVVLAAVLMLRFMRLATVVNASGIAVKGFVATRRVPWSRIQAITVELNPSHFTESRHPRQIAVAYRDTGRRLHLRGIDDKNLAASNLQLSTVVESLRQRWIAGRGEGWRPVAAVQAKAAELSRFLVSAAVIGLLWFMSTIGIMAVLATALVLIKGELGLPVFVDSGSGLFLPVLLGLLFGVPIVAGVAGGLHSAAQRRRARTRVGWTLRTRDHPQ
jgi:hypothetical protein